MSLQDRIGVMQLIDTLDIGGAERVAVNIANCLPQDRYRSFLCATRRGGQLAELIEPQVKYCCLCRKTRIDLFALSKLIRYIRENDIQLLHAHSTSIVTANLAHLLLPSCGFIWHDHYGRYATHERWKVPYRLLTRRCRGVIAANQALADWSISSLGIPRSKVWYIPNFVDLPREPYRPIDLPGRSDSRIVCVANLRPQKDHITLIRAFKMVVTSYGDAQLLLIGNHHDRKCVREIRAEIARLDLAKNLTIMGVRQDVFSILSNCAIGVISSTSEGFPLSLVEFGFAKLAVIATHVGQCPEVLDNGKAGILVPPSDPKALADGLITLLENPLLRRRLGSEFNRRVEQVYNKDAAMGAICEIYQALIGR